MISYLEIPDALAHTINAHVREFICGSHWESPTTFVTFFFFPEGGCFRYGYSAPAAGFRTLYVGRVLSCILTSKEAYSHLFYYDISRCLEENSSGLARFNQGKALLFGKSYRVFSSLMWCFNIWEFQWFHVAHSINQSWSLTLTFFFGMSLDCGSLVLVVGAFSSSFSFGRIISFIYLFIFPEAFLSTFFWCNSKTLDYSGLYFIWGIWFLRNQTLYTSLHWIIPSAS